MRLQHYLQSPFPWPLTQTKDSPRKRKLKEELKAQKQKNAKLQAEKTVSETKVKQLEKTKAIAASTVTELAKVKQDNVVLQKEKMELEKAEKELEAKLVKLETNMDKLINQFDPVKSDLQKYIQKYREKEREMATLQEEYEQILSNLTKAKDKLSHLNTRNVNKRIGTREKSCRSLQIENAALKGEVESVRLEVDQVKHQLALSTHDAQQKEVAIDMLQNQLAQNRKEKRTLYKHGWYMDKREEKRRGETNKIFGEEYIRQLTQKMKVLDERNKELEQLFVLLESEEIETFHDGKYDDEVREVIMDLLCMNVGMNKVNDVIRAVLQKLAKKDIGRLPSNHIKSNLLMEARFLADVEVAEAMRKGADLQSVLGNSIHGDGTTKFHKKYQNFQVTLDDGTQRTLALKPMGASDTDAVMKCFTDRVRELSDALQIVTGNESEEENAKLFASVKSTMTDQGPTMPQFSEKLKVVREELLPAAYSKWDELPDDLQATTKEFCTFYCKMHPLINFATECDKVLKAFEDVATSGKSFHTFLTAEAGVTRLIRTSSQAFHRRGSDKSGVEEFFTPYLLKQHNTKNHLVHYIGNRANILFEGAAAAYYHLRHMESFLQLLPDPNHLLKAVQEDLSEPIHAAELLALGIIHKLITQPFWHIIKTSPNILICNNSVRMPDHCSRKPVFMDIEVVEDEVYEALFAEHDPAQETMCIQALELICTAMLLILERQCRDQLPGGIYWETDTTAWSNVPATNMVGERDFAVLDLLIRQKPAARTTSLEALIMWSNNKTSTWLNDLDPDTKQKYMAEARTRSGSLIDKYHSRMEEIRSQKWETLKQKQKEKGEKERRQMGQALKLAKGVEKRTRRPMDNSIRSRRQSP
ncbi:uncharacterized protein [Amphiura filiformis]|uniref:uncharacterized protein n=1 Tax=Amphiura filiformis TaxID=82378 RepID=UPI003B21A70D